MDLDGESEPDDDGPVTREWGATEAFDTTIAGLLTSSGELGRVLERGDTPTLELLQRLRDGVHEAKGVVTGTANALRSQPTAKNSGGGNGRNNSLATIIGAALVSIGVAIGVPGLSSADDAAQARVLAEQAVKGNDELAKRVEQVESARELGEIAMRRNLGLTVRWLGDEQMRHCRNSEALAKALNWIAKRESKRGSSDAYKEVTIDCDSGPLLPPELDKLRADSRDAIE